MSSLSRELVCLILQFLDEEKFKETVHRSIFFILFYLFILFGLKIDIFYKASFGCREKRTMKNNDFFIYSFNFLIFYFFKCCVFYGNLCVFCFVFTGAK